MLNVNTKCMLGYLRLFWISSNRTLSNLHIFSRSDRSNLLNVKCHFKKNFLVRSSPLGKSKHDDFSGLHLKIRHLCSVADPVSAKIGKNIIQVGTDSVTLFYG